MAWSTAFLLMFALGLVGLGSILSGCQAAETGEPGSTRQADNSQQPASTDAAESDASAVDGQSSASTPASGTRKNIQKKPLPAGQLATPPGVERRRLLPYQGQELVRASSTLAQILASLPEDARVLIPKVKDAAAQGEQAETDQKDVPRAAQMAYINGRIALDEGRMQEAILQLKIALGIAPDNADIARLLAMSYLSIGNRPAGAMYLEQALKLDPEDIDSLIKLGRLSLERGRWEEAVALLAHALEMARKAEPSSPALEQICEFNLGSALEVGGYDQASVEQYLSSMDGRSQLTDKAAATGQMMLLSRQFGNVWQSIGDARLRLGKPAMALKAYDNAIDAGVSNLPGWITRYVYTQLLLGNTEQATMRVAEFMKSQEQPSRWLMLAEYLIENGGDSNSLVSIFQSIYANSDSSSSMAILISRLLPRDKSEPFLMSHLKDHPQDTSVAILLFRQALLEGSKSQGSQQAPPADFVPTDAAAVKALRIAAELISNHPEQASLYAESFLELLNNKPRLQTIVGQLEAGEQNSVPVRFIIAEGHLRQGNLKQARPVLEKITLEQPSFIPARVLLARQLAGRGQFNEAGKLLEGLDTEPWLSQADQLRVGIFTAQGKFGEALQLLDKLIAREPAKLEWSMGKASLQIRSGQPVLAERTLLDLLNVYPRTEAIYRALFELYDSGAIPDFSTQYQRLMVRMYETIPQSHIARMQQVEMLVVRRELNQAEQILRQMLQENPKDLEALQNLVSILHESDKTAAEKLIEDNLTLMGDDANMIQFAADYYQANGNPEKAFQLRERMANLVADPSQKAFSLALVYLQWDKLEQAQKQARIAMTGDPQNPQQTMSLLLGILWRIAQVNPAEIPNIVNTAKADVAQAVTQFPDQEADMRYELASLFSRLGDENASIDEMKSILVRFPKHAPSNNGVGYYWADKGIELEKAKALIQIAVDADPQNSAYLDSLGWVYYKLAMFDEAVHWLSLAVMDTRDASPVIMDHLGDAYYRAGNVNLADNWWKRASQLLQQKNFSGDPESNNLGDILKTKISAAARKQPVQVAPSGAAPVIP